MTTKFWIIVSMFCAVAFSVTAQTLDVRPPSQQGYQKNMRKAQKKQQKQEKQLQEYGMTLEPPIHIKIRANLKEDFGDAIDFIKEYQELNEPYDGKTPIYLIMEYLATHKKQECISATKMLQAMLERKDFDINQGYRNLLPPFSYMLRRNHEFLNGNLSSDYLDEDMLKMCIEHGAPVTSYFQDGSSLMDFAIDTGNKNLQSFLLNHDVNLAHKDKEGHNAIYSLIADGNLDIIRESIQQNKIDLNIHSLENEPISFAQHKELYDFVAQHCADKANTYDDIILFRNRFLDKAYLTQQKYEDMARREVNASSDFEAITRCESRYPDLTSITGPKKLAIAERELSAATTIDNVKTFEARYPNWKEKTTALKQKIYQADCLVLRESHNQMKAGLQNHNETANTTVSSKFIKDYSGYYDPQNLIPLATAMNVYANVLSTAQGKYGPYYSADNNLESPYRSDVQKLNDALSECKSLQAYSLSSDWLIGTINSKKQYLYAHYEECKKALEQVNRVGVTNTPQPRMSQSGRDFHCYFDNFSFIITNYSKHESDYEDRHYVVHAMRGGKLSHAFIKGYGTLAGAVTAGWAAATYGFSKGDDWDPPQKTGSLIGQFMNSKLFNKFAMDLENARQTDVGLEAFDL